MWQAPRLQHGDGALFEFGQGDSKVEKVSEETGESLWVWAVNHGCAFGTAPPDGGNQRFAPRKSVISGRVWDISPFGKAGTKAPRGRQGASGNKTPSGPDAWMRRGARDGGQAMEKLSGKISVWQSCASAPGKRPSIRWRAPKPSRRGSRKRCCPAQRSDPSDRRRGSWRATGR